MKQVYCPICQAEATAKGDSPNGGWLFVGESFDRDVETYDPDIVEYQCTKVKKHTFYISK